MINVSEIDKVEVRYVKAYRSAKTAVCALRNFGEAFKVFVHLHLSYVVSGAAR